jgi:hypothetical protein
LCIDGGVKGQGIIIVHPASQKTLDWHGAAQTILFCKEVVEIRTFALSRR